MTRFKSSIRESLRESRSEWALDAAYGVLGALRQALSEKSGIG